MKSSNIAFTKLSCAHQQQVFEWLDKPHIKEFWDNSIEHRQDIVLFINGRQEPSPYADGIFTYWIGTINNDPYCLLMTSDMIDVPELPEYYRPYLASDGKTCSLDFMVGNDKYVGQGLAAPTLQAFMKFMKNVDKSITRFIIDPEESNPRAKHVYEKAGFMVVDEFVSTKGTGKGLKHFLMVKDLA